VIDYKYHVTALVAVFLALGIGMLIGSMVLGSEFMSEQQNALIDQLENDFQQMRIQHGLTKSELTAANRMIDTYQEFCSQAMPALIKDKLRDYRVVILQTNNSFDAQEIIDPLRIAGAEVKGAVTVMEDFTLANVSSTLQVDLDKGEELVRVFAEAILFGENTDLISALTGKNLIRMTGELGGPIDAVILVGGNQGAVLEQAKWLDTSLLDYFIDNSVNVVGVEPSSTPYSYMSLYQAKHIATVDNVDTIPGKISLVYSLLGEKGDFGIKKTAKKLMPQLW